MSDDNFIHRRTLHGELTTLVRDMVIRGELRPGSRIREQALCDRFGVSRTPLREALKVLSAQGLVRLLPNRGATVMRVTRKDVDDLIPILGALLAFAGELTCARIGDIEIARVRALHERMIQHCRQGEELPYMELDRSIQAAIFEAAGNEALAEINRTLQMRLYIPLSVPSKSPLRWVDTIEGHERMMESLEARDGTRFALVARKHMEHRAEIMRQMLNTTEGRADSVIRGAAPSHSPRIDVVLGRSGALATSNASNSLPVVQPTSPRP
jgi:DNA-binding GntR family transcriptional regulator